MVNVNAGMSGTEKETYLGNSDVYCRIECLPTGNDYLGLCPYLFMSNSSLFVNNYRRQFMQLILNDFSLSLGISALDFFLQYRCVKVLTSLTTSRWTLDRTA